MATKKLYRLPTDVIPRNYHLHLTPSFVNFKFMGDLKICVEVAKETTEIVMHSADLEIKTAKVGSVDADIWLNADEETLTLRLPEPLEIGYHEIFIHFVGTHNDDMRGFYRAKFTNRAGEDEYSLVTQLAVRI